MNNGKIARLLRDNIPYGGVTLSKDGKVLTTGIAVALNATSEYKFKRQHSRWTEIKILQWLIHLPKGKYGYGMWVDNNDMVYLDRIKVFKNSDLSGAISHANTHNQMAVQFLDQNITLWLTEPQTDPNGIQHID